MNRGRQGLGCAARRARLGVAALLTGLLFAGAAAAAGETYRPAPNGQTPHMNYLHYCAGCHLPDGTGKPSHGIPNMRGVLGQFLRVEGGREFIVKVPGVSHTPLADSDIAALMNWLLDGIAQPSKPPGTPPYTAAEVTRLRSERLVDIPGTRKQIVERLERAGYSLER